MPLAPAPLLEEPLLPDLPLLPDADPFAFDPALEEAVFEPEPRPADWPPALAPPAPLALAPLLEEPLLEGPLWPDLSLLPPDADPLAPALDDALLEPDPLASDWPATLGPPLPLAFEPFLEAPPGSDLPLPGPDADPPEPAWSLLA